MNDRRAVRGKEFPFLILAPGRKLMMISILYRDAGVRFHEHLSKVASKHNLRAVSVFKQVLKEGSEWTLFLDVTETENPEEVVKDFQRLPGILDIYASKPEVGILADTFHFPLTSRKGVRMIIFSAEMFSRTLGELYKTFGSGARFIIYRTGFTYGYELGEYFRNLLEGLMEKPPPPAKIIEFFLHYNMSAGWQIPEEIDIKEKDGKIEAVVRIRELFEASARKHFKFDEVGCDLFRGLLAGLFSSLYGGEFKASEVKCEARGDEYCEFQITQL